MSKRGWCTVKKRSFDFRPLDSTIDRFNEDGGYLSFHFLLLLKVIQRCDLMTLQQNTKLNGRSEKMKRMVNWRQHQQMPRIYVATLYCVFAEVILFTRSEQAKYKCATETILSIENAFVCVCSLSPFLLKLVISLSCLFVFVFFCVRLFVFHDSKQNKHVLNAENKWWLNGFNLVFCFQFFCLSYFLWSNTKRFIWMKIEDINLRKNVFLSLHFELIQCDFSISFALFDSFIFWIEDNIENTICSFELTIYERAKYRYRNTILYFVVGFSIPQSTRSAKM